ncbi:MAG: pyrroloquinoline quinone-dependent dehydrogenase [Albidovulum sp.]
MTYPHRPTAAVIALLLAAGAPFAYAQESVVPAVAPAGAAAAAPGAGWTTFNGNLAAQKFSPETQITPANVDRLQQVWDLHTGDVSDGSGKLPESVWSATPLFVNDTVYLGTPFYRIFALEPDTGKVKWTYDSKSTLKALSQPALKNRGVAYWQAAAPAEGQPCEKRIYLGTMEGTLHAVDADTGKLCADFGQGGVLDLNQWNTINPEFPLSILQPPTVYKDTLFIGWAGKDWAASVNPPGSVFAVDARTGKLKWQFYSLPPKSYDRTGTANVWASMSVDEQRGIVYLPISSPSPDFYGGNRKEPLPLATSVTALDAETGEVIWSRQLVHHDIWDYDTNSAPTLVDIEKDGQTIPALVQTSKQGMIYVLNRETGEPVFPLEERPVPASDVPGEVAAPTQPFADTPPPVVDAWPGIFRLADWLSLGYCSRTYAGLRHEGLFTPPSLQGTIAYPPTSGGVEWGGGAVDPVNQIFYVNSSSIAQIFQLVPRDEYQKMTAKRGDQPGYSEQKGVPYGLHLTNFMTSLGIPCWKPPYGFISAYDLKTGERLYKVPFGVTQKWGFYMPQSWGSPTIGAPALTASGLLFIGGSMDARVRALDAATGKALWQAQVQAPAVAMPAVYTYQGREYVVFVAGGNSILKEQVGDQVVAYALPGGKAN